jgi:two-component system KDP operon response regulator KdpE
MSSTDPTILVIEDDTQIRKLLRISLESHGMRITETTSARDGLLSAANEPPDVVILDLGLPDQDGLQVIKRIREWSRVPILVLSARGHESDKVISLDAGADDYLTKPFSVGELIARIRVALRHAARSGDAAESPVFEAGDLKVDLTRRQVWIAGNEVHLTPTEYRLLTTLVKHAGKVVTHRQLLREVWGPGSTEANENLRVYMGQLRRKIEADTTHPRYLRTEPGIGYRLIDEP